MSAASNTGRPAGSENGVGTVVRRAGATLALVRGVEGFLFAVAGALLVRCAGEWSAVGNWRAGENLGLMAFVGVLAGSAWFCEQRLASWEVAHRLDRRLRYQGALLLAFELEGRDAPRLLLDDLVCARVRSRLNLAEARRVLAPSPFLPLAAPTLALLCLLVTLDVRRASAPRAVDLQRLARGLEMSLLPALEGEENAPEAFETAGEGLERERERARAALSELSSELTRGAAAPTPVERRTALERLDVELARLEARDPEDGRWSEARTWVDAMRAGLEARAGTTGDGSPAGGLTGPPANGTISPPVSPLSASVPAAPPADPAPSTGPSSGSWWPSEYDEIVARWVESSRARASSR
jgi:hypothetical protein